ncbi:hypothetical protein HDU93_007392 [Gonapodya sp. JEL0774]|nr:hypothetical protein HDU93_007392 [Gonapodya sp. JEL0774]
MDQKRASKIPEQSVLSSIGTAIWSVWNFAQGFVNSTALLFTQDSRTVLKTATWPYETYKPDFQITELSPVSVEYVKAIRSSLLKRNGVSASIHDVVYSVISRAIIKYISKHPIPGESPSQLRVLSLAALPKGGRAEDDFIGNAWGIVSLTVATGVSAVETLIDAAQLNAGAKYRCTCFIDVQQPLTFTLLTFFF